MTPQEQMADIKSKTTEEKSISNIRPVIGGFIVNATTNWRDPESGGYVMSRNDECIASSPQDAAQKALNYLTAGNFDGAPAFAPPAPPPVDALGAAPAPVV